MNGRGVLLALAVVAVASTPVVSASTSVAPPIESDAHSTEITDCTTITEPGEYVLADDLRNVTPTDPDRGLGACIAVRADDVTLQGQNHTVAGGNRPGVVGVLVGGEARRSNVTVRNLTTTGWGAGVAAFDATGATFRNVSATGNLGDGFFAERAPGLEIVGGVVRGSNTGLFVRNADGARIANVTVAENIAGVEIRRSDGAAVRGVETNRNRLYGVGIFRSANATVADSGFAGNGFAGVALSGSDDARLRNLTVDATVGPRGGEPVGVFLNDSVGVRLVGVSVSDGPGWTLSATGGSSAVGEGVRLGETRLSFEVRDAALDAADDPPPLPTERQTVGDPLFVVPTSADAALSVSIRYADDAVARASATEDSLSLWRLDAGEGWHRAETALDTERNVASGSFAELAENGTVVALVGEGLAESSNRSA